jgi:hypothetical protein
MQRLPDKVNSTLTKHWLYLIKICGKLLPKVNTISIRTQKLLDFADYGQVSSLTYYRFLLTFALASPRRAS